MIYCETVRSCIILRDILIGVRGWGGAMQEESFRIAANKVRRLKRLLIGD